MTKTSGIDGYIYDMSDPKRLDIYNSIADLYAYAEDWTAAYSTNYSDTNTNNNNEYWNQALTDADKIYTQVNYLLESIFKHSYPYTVETLFALAPPGNSFVFNAGQINEQHINTPGALWNVWAVYTQYLNPGSQVNNMWNNSWAQGIPLSEATNPSSTNPPAEGSSAYISHFSTIPTSGSTQDPDYRFLDPDNNGTSFLTYTDEDPLSDTYGQTVPYTTQESLEDDQDYRYYLVQSLYDFKSIMPTYLKDAAKSISGNFTATTSEGTTNYNNSHILKRPALQDTLFFNYALAGQSQLQEELGTTTDEMRTAEHILHALNLLNTVFSQEPEVDRHLHLRHNDQSYGDTYSSNDSNFLNPLGYNISVWAVRNYLLSGYSMLNAIYNRGVVTDSIGISLVTSILNFTQSAVNAIRTYNEISNTSMATSINRISAFGAISGLWMGVGFGDTSTDLGANKAANSINNAVANYEFVNETLKQDLKKAIMIYEEFVSSSTAGLQKLQSIFRSIAQKARQ
jgi:hypothetical protein